MFISSLTNINRSYVDNSTVLDMLSRALAETSEVENLVANIEHSVGHPITELKYGRILSSGNYEYDDLVVLVPHTQLILSEPTLTMYLYPFDILGIVLDTGGEQTQFMTQLENPNATTIHSPRSSGSSRTNP